MLHCVKASLTSSLWKRKKTTKKHIPPPYAVRLKAEGLEPNTMAAALSSGTNRDLAV